jgi:secondary thiamine-phosphate synthase enzyme
VKSIIERVTITTVHETQVINITDVVLDIVKKSEVRSGFFFVISLHTTTGIFINEGIFDVEADIIDTVMRLVPDDGSYRHARYLPSDGQMGVNAVSHIRSVLLGFECFFPIENGAPVMGGRQTIYFVELDGPQERTLVVQIFGV